MRYLSVCSGIEAATVAWAPLGWSPLGFAEIEAFPSAVLAHHYGSNLPGQPWSGNATPNFGDMTKFKDWPDAAIDVLVGGTPCQSFSVAGLRKGMADPRGNLALTYLAIADRYRPEWLVWENVPGVISDKTDALKSILDGMEALGYVIDIDILDAQFFGLAQRRKRVFICGQHRDALLKTRTSSSALTIAQCLTEIFHSALLAGSSRFASVRESSACAGLSKDGARRRISLFGLSEESGLWPKWLQHLGEAGLKSAQGSSDWVSVAGDNQVDCTLDAPWTDSSKAGPSTLTAPSWQESLAEALGVATSFTTSTETREITQREIYICSKAVLIIGALIARLKPSLPSFWSAASSNLTAVQDCIAYARSASSDLFTELEWLQSWRDFLRQAERANQSLRNIRVGNFGKVFPLSESLSGNPPPRREAGQGTTRDVAPSLTSGGRSDNPADSRGQDAVIAIPSTGDVSHCLNAGGMGRIDYETETMIAHALRADGFDASEDGTGRGTPIVPVVAKTLTRGAESAGKGGYAGRRQDDDDNLVAFDCKAGANTGFAVGDVPGALRGVGHGGGHAAIAFAENSRAEVRLEGGDGQTVSSLKVGGGKAGQSYPAIAQGWAVRRLTPRECERLQGFPEDFTLIPYRGKPAADGPRYKALGNSMACNVMRWLGRRIELVSGLVAETEKASA